MDQRLIDALESHAGIHAWTVRMRHVIGLQTYLIGETVESERDVERVAYEVEVYNDHVTQAGPRRGGA